MYKLLSNWVFYSELLNWHRKLTSKIKFWWCLTQLTQVNVLRSFFCQLVLKKWGHANLVHATLVFVSLTNVKFRNVFWLLLYADDHKELMYLLRLPIEWIPKNLLNLNFQYLAHRIQQPITKIWILNFHE